MLTQGGVNPTVASVLIGVAIGAGQGRIEGGFGRVNDDGSVNLHSSVSEQSLADLREAGQLVEQISEGLYRVSSYENSNNSMLLRFTNDATLLAPTSAEAASIAVHTPEGEITLADTGSEAPKQESDLEASAASTAVKLFECRLL